jgi:eukaryotic-like serine/threonine-protein kinase
MGVVYEAQHEALGRRVAIKILHALAPETPKAEVGRARFLREGRVAAQVRHDHVVDVFDFGVHEGTPFLVMELVQGESLAERIDREGTLPVATALELLLPICSAVGALHAAGIIHRDLKPANILIGKGNSGEVSPKVADFGVSRVDDDSLGLTDTGVVVGSYPYMPPEQARACKTATEQADQYALGAILYECVTGKPPFEGGSQYELTHAILHAPLVPPSERKSGLPKGLDAVLLRALSRDPECRFPCVEDFGGALLPFASSDVVRRWASEFVLAASGGGGAGKTTATVGTIPPVSSSFTNAGADAPVRRPWRTAIAVSAMAFAGVALVALAFREPSQPHDDATGGVGALPPPIFAAAPVLANAPPRVPSPDLSPTPPSSAPSAPIVLARPVPMTPPMPHSKAGAPTPARAKLTPPAHALIDDRRDEGSPLDNGAPILDPR